MAIHTIVAKELKEAAIVFVLGAPRTTAGFWFFELVARIRSNGRLGRRILCFIEINGRCDR